MKRVFFAACFFILLVYMSSSCTLFSQKTFSIEYVDNIPMNDYAFGVSMQGDFAFVSDYSMGARIIDIDKCEEVSSVNGFYWARNSFPSGNYLYIADRDLGLIIADISLCSSPSVISEFNTEGYEEAVIVQGDYAYLASDYGGLNILDISDKESPELVSTIYFSDMIAENVALKDSILFIADYNSGVKIYNVSDASHPVLISVISIPGNPNDLAVAEDILFVSTRYKGVHSVDISNLTSPHEIDNFLLSAECWGLCFKKGYIFAAFGMAGLAAIKAEDGIFSETVVSNTDSWAYDVCVNDTILLVADGLGGLQIFSYDIP